MVENAFNWPGIGTMIVEAIKNRDYNIVNIYLVFIGGLFILLNTAIEAMAEISQLFKVGGVKFHG